MKALLPFINTLAIITMMIYLLNSKPTPVPSAPDIIGATEKTAVEEPADGNVQFALSALRAALEEERLQRQALEQQLAALSRQLSPDSQDSAAEETPAKESAAAPADNSNNLQSREILLSYGLDASRISAIEDKVEEQEMAQLYLRNQAVREGWFGTERYFKEFRTLDDDGNVYRQELGDEMYDRYLYDSRRPNRVSVSDVISDSPAEKAGLQAGDIVLSYDNERVFAWNDLTSATAGGQPGETVLVKIIRKGQEMDMYLPRGPIGIRLDATRSEP